jgi:lambda repressor-like predicted transcriptional regulator
MPQALSWTPEHIALALKRQGWNKSRIARELGLPYSTVWYGITTGSSPKVCRFVSQVIGVEEVDLWPWRYPPQWRTGA